MGIRQDRLKRVLRNARGVDHWRRKLTENSRIQGKSEDVWGEMDE
jgi:hypothetical protein